MALPSKQDPLIGLAGVTWPLRRWEGSANEEVRQRVCLVLETRVLRAMGLLDGVRELSPVGCPLTFTSALWCACTHVKNVTIKKIK